MLWERLEAHWQYAPKARPKKKAGPDAGVLLQYRTRMLSAPTRGERRFRDAYRQAGIKYELQSQKIFLNTNVNPHKAYIVDFFIEPLALIVEIDGPTHEGKEARKYDRKRTAFLHSRGFRVIRYTNLETASKSFPDTIRSKINSFAWPKKRPRKVANYSQFKTPSDKSTSTSPRRSRDKAKPLPKYIVRKKTRVDSPMAPVIKP